MFKGKAAESLGAIAFMFLSVVIGYFDISKLGFKVPGASGEFETRPIDAPTGDAAQALGEVNESVNAVAAKAARAVEVQFEAAGEVKDPGLTDDVGLTDRVVVQLRQDVRPQLERVLANGIEAGYIAAKMGWQSVPRPVVTWPEEGGDPVISYMVGDPPAVLSSTSTLQA